MPSPEKLDNHQLKEYFLEHLNRIYGAKLDISAKLPSIADHADFIDLRDATIETLEDIQQQIENMLEIYRALNATYMPTSRSGSSGLLNDLYETIFRQKDDRIMRDLSILFYMQNMESLEVSSFKILMMIAKKMDNQNIIQLLKENIDLANDDRKLMTVINQRFLRD
ncbi:DUF892 family protein [Mucilaginibacter ginkgonis]|uniref:DUF892 family protein n=1 Tax=Mucilaginibacter ginkgonis TaxID=2682091 RepID=A0A7T7F987_9SPHI|nr:DUF892 family protein [Mucilaginibacter ginkgonis]QQL49146.1 DUF892 family protein [Mucilaginibacter ginkgonis]